MAGFCVRGHIEIDASFNFVFEHFIDALHVGAGLGRQGVGLVAGRKNLSVGFEESTPFVVTILFEQPFL